MVVPVTRYEMITPHLRRGKKFDWLYDQWLEIDAFGEFANELETHKKTWVMRILVKSIKLILDNMFRNT